MAINDVLPLKAAQCDAIANFKRLWVPIHQQPNFDLFIYIRCICGATLFSSHQRHLPPVWQNLVGLYVCRVQRVATKQNAEFTVCE